jgi:uncharacterized membrane protein YsdA (DUF1294 family)
VDRNLYWIWLAASSAVTFLLYGFDKAQSKSRGWRVPENLLHLLALVGGFPGGWAGRAIFRHKTQHAIFTFVLVVSTLAHLGLVFWLFLK